MKKLLASLSVFCAISSHAFVIGDEVQLMNVGMKTHPASVMHMICSYQDMTGQFKIRTVVQGFCPMFINYDITTNTWSR